MAVKSTYRNGNGMEGTVLTSNLGSNSDEEGLCEGADA